MNEDIWPVGVVDGVLSGFACGTTVAVFDGIFVFSGLPWFAQWGNPAYRPPMIPAIVGLGVEWLIATGLLLGAILGLIFCHFHPSVKDHVQVRRGFKYGAVLSLPYLAVGVKLMRYLDTLRIVVLFAISLGFPVFLFGSLLVLIWNWKWEI
nr:hypothetical protein [Candidatus Njordarchaeota archaeon]